MRIQEPRNPTFRMNRACEGDLLPTRRSHSLDEKVDRCITDSRSIFIFLIFIFRPLALRVNARPRIAGSVPSSYTGFVVTSEQMFR